MSHVMCEVSCVSGAYPVYLKKNLYIYISYLFVSFGVDIIHELTSYILKTKISRNGLAKGRSFLQELEEGQHSVPYLLVPVIPTIPVIPGLSTGDLLYEIVFKVFA